MIPVVIGTQKTLSWKFNTKSRISRFDGQKSYKAKLEIQGSDTIIPQHNINHSSPQGETNAEFNLHIDIKYAIVKTQLNPQ